MTWRTFDFGAAGFVRKRPCGFINRARHTGAQPTGKECNDTRCLLISVPGLTRLSAERDDRFQIADFMRGQPMKPNMGRSTLRSFRRCDSTRELRTVAKRVQEAPSIVYLT